MAKIKIGDKVKVEFAKGYHGNMVAVVVGIIEGIGAKYNGEPIYRVYIPEEARQRADKIICGMHDCMCGGIVRCDVMLVRTGERLYPQGEGDYSTARDDF